MKFSQSLIIIIFWSQIIVHPSVHVSISFRGSTEHSASRTLKKAKGKICLQSSDTLSQTDKFILYILHSWLYMLWRAKPLFKYDCLSGNAGCKGQAWCFCTMIEVLKSHPQSEKGKKVTFSSPKKWIFMWVTRSKQTLRCAKASILFFLSWDAREFARGTTNWSVLYSTIGNLTRFDEAESSKCKHMDFARRDAPPRMYISAATDRWESSLADGSPMSWWLDREGEMRSYWGGFLPGVQQCSCSLEENCMDMNYFCNCDADTDSWYVWRELFPKRPQQLRSILGGGVNWRPSKRSRGYDRYPHPRSKCEIPKFKVHDVGQNRRRWWKDFRIRT